MTSDLPFLTLAEAAREIAAKRLSPVELTQALLERAYALNPTLNAYITITAASALQEAREAEAEIARGEYRGPLHGVPIALKDLYTMAGVRTTGGSKILSDWVPEEDCTVVSKLKGAGAVFLGKLNMHEFAYGISNVNPHYGPARNPWDPERITGGSSGGSGAATASGMCMASLGSDTGGSIRIPACLCGIVGIKPTYGRVSRHGVLPLAWSLDHAGPMTRTAEDAALLLSVIAGHDPQDPSSLDVPVPDYTQELNRGARGLRIGVLGGPIIRALHPEVEAAMAEALGVLKGLGAELQEEVVVPAIEYASAANTTIIMAEAAAYHQRWLDSRSEEYGQEVRTRLTMGRLLPATLYIQANRARRRIREEVLRSLDQLDLLALPMLPLPAPRIGEERVRLGEGSADLRTAITHYCGLFNLTGLPAISVPCGFISEGLPVGFQLAGRPLDEGTLLRAAHAYEGATSWQERRPTLTTDA